MGSLIHYHLDEMKVARAYLEKSLDKNRALVALDMIAPMICSGLTVQDIGYIMGNRHNKEIWEIDISKEISAMVPMTYKGGSDKLVDGYLSNLGQAMENGLSFLFFGFNGGGKSYTAKYLLYKSIEAGYSGYYTTMADLQKLYNKISFSARASELEEFMLEHMRTCDLLVIDELGKETLSDAFLVMMESILKGRSSRDRATILVTNIQFVKDGKSDFMDRYGSSIFNLLYQHYRVFIFSKHGEFRKKERKEWF